LTTTVTDIWTVVEPYLAAERLELDDVELLGRGQGTLLRVVVDGEGVDVDRLADVSRGLSGFWTTRRTCRPPTGSK
jgi:ribosome maturation factor RimP